MHASFPELVSHISVVDALNVITSHLGEKNPFKIFFTVFRDSAQLVHTIGNKDLVGKSIILHEIFDKASHSLLYKIAAYFMVRKYNTYYLFFLSS